MIQPNLLLEADSCGVRPVQPQELRMASLILMLREELDIAKIKIRVIYIIKF